jgi:hypothetical protein
VFCLTKWLGSGPDVLGRSSDHRKFPNVETLGDFHRERNTPFLFFGISRTLMAFPKKEIAPVDQPPERLRKSFVDVSLANLGAQEFAVVFYADASTGQQVGHGRNRLLGAFGAGADGEDKVTEREFRTRFEDLFGRFHDQSHLLEQIQCHFVQSIL